MYSDKRNDLIVRPFEIIQFQWGAFVVYESCMGCMGGGFVMHGLPPVFVFSLSTFVIELLARSLAKDQ